MTQGGFLTIGIWSSFHDGLRLTPTELERCPILNSFYPRSVRCRGDTDETPYHFVDRASDIAIFDAPHCKR